MDSTTNKNGGELPWAPRGRFEPAFDHWAWRLEPGQFSPVIETSYGFHIVKVDRKQAAEVKTRHILIQPAVDSADAALARARADSAAAMLRQGVPFDSVADRFNDPTANDRFVPVYQLDSLPPNYAQAVAGLKTGDITAPFETPDTRSAFPTHAVLAIASAEEERPYSDEEIRAVIRRQMQDVAATRAFIDKMRKQLYIRTMM
jgi:peptidyl-prolyl cis-trans isomerase SurA